MYQLAISVGYKQQKNVNQFSLSNKKVLSHFMHKK